MPRYLIQKHFAIQIGSGYLWWEFGKLLMMCSLETERTSWQAKKATVQLRYIQTTHARILRIRIYQYAHIRTFIIQQIVTLSKYGHDALDVCHP